MALPLLAGAAMGGSKGLGSTFLTSAAGSLGSSAGSGGSSGPDGQSYGKIGSRIQSGITAGVLRAQDQRNWEEELELEKLRMSLMLQQARGTRDELNDKRRFRNAMLGI